MGAEFRWLALVAGVGSALFGASLSWIVAFVLFRVQRDQVGYGDPLIAPWIAVLIITLTTTVVVAVSWYANLRLAERRSARTAHAMRQLIQRAEEYGAGGFALEPITESLVVSSCRLPCTWSFCWPRAARRVGTTISPWRVSPSARRWCSRRRSRPR